MIWKQTVRVRADIIGHARINMYVNLSHAWFKMADGILQSDVNLAKRKEQMEAAAPVPSPCINANAAELAAHRARADAPWRQAGETHSGSPDRSCSHERLERGCFRGVASIKAGA